MSEKRLDENYEPLAYRLRLLYLLYIKTPLEQRNTAEFWRKVAKCAVEFLKEVPTNGA